MIGPQGRIRAREGPTPKEGSLTGESFQHTEADGITTKISSIQREINISKGLSHWQSHCFEALKRMDYLEKFSSPRRETNI